MDIPSPATIKPLLNYRVWVKYTDGVEGEVDFTHLVGKGVFKCWDNYRNFQKVFISEAGAIAWSETIEICPDSVYLKLTGKSVEDLFPCLRVGVASQD